jgi:tRNA(Ile)-lysidine synthase
MAVKEHKNSLDQRVLKYVLANRLIQQGQKVLVAVSGGPDSVCLLHVLFKLQKELQITLHIAHLDHALRGEESEGDAQYVAELAQKLGIPAAIEKKAVKAYQKTHRLSLEEAAREVRYSFLADTARAVGAKYVAAGHTLNDQAETILLHIIRGTGTRGLRGLQPSQTLQFADRKLVVIRPLLEIRREETMAYCKLHRLSPRTDSSNKSTDILRNRVRHELLPLLKDYNAGIVDSLLRMSRIAADDVAFLEAESETVWKRIVRRQKGIFIFEKPAFLSLAPSLQRQLLRRAIESLLGTLKDIETRHIEEIFRSLSKPAGRCIDLPEGLVFVIEYHRFLLGPQPETLSPFPQLIGEHGLTVPGVTNLLGWRIEATLTATEKIGSTADNQNGFTSYLDWAKTGNDIKVRSFRQGDRFQPLGLGEEKKVARFLLDARVPRFWRPNLPIFYTPQQIIWVAGYRLDDRVKVTSGTREVLCLRMARQG